MVIKTLSVTLLSLAFLISCGGSDNKAAKDTLLVGTMLPSGSELGYLNGPTLQAANMAAMEINAVEAGRIRLIHKTGADQGTATEEEEDAKRVATELVAENVSAIVGASSSRIGLAILDTLVTANTILISPSNTSPTFATREDNGLHFRTVPSDILQGRVLARLAREGGSRRLGIVYRNDNYGQKLAEEIEKSLEGSEIAVALSLGYGLDEISNPESFSPSLQQMQSSNLDALVLISFQEIAHILRALADAGMGPDSLPTYLSDGFIPSDLGTMVNGTDPAVVDGIRAVAPSPFPPGGQEGFEQRLRAFAPSLQDFLFSSQSYDAVILLALASLQAQSYESVAMSKQMVDLTKGGTKCSNYADCAGLIEQGVNIDYDGASGQLEFTDTGEPSEGSYNVFFI